MSVSQSTSSRSINSVQAGDRFGRLTIIAEAVPDKRGNRRALCRCRCGRFRVARLGHLMSKNVTSCGCYQREAVARRSTIHGKYHTPEYEAWHSMKQRCCNTHSKKFKDYGARGITVCSRWLKSFENFLADMGPKPGPSYSIERIDNAGNYEPSNCRWDLPKSQNRNRRNNHLVTHDGKTMTIAEWSEVSGISHTAISKRLNRYGWSISRALTTPARKRRRSTS